MCKWTFFYRTAKWCKVLPLFWVSCTPNIFSRCIWANKFSKKKLIGLEVWSPLQGQWAQGRSPVRRLGGPMKKTAAPSRVIAASSLFYPKLNRKVLAVHTFKDKGCISWYVWIAYLVVPTAVSAPQSLLDLVKYDISIVYSKSCIVTVALAFQ